jgi:acyl-CoA reductase-like NAD-dependent aldehyde dehydrogenase
MVQHVRRAGRRGRGDRVELTGPPIDPITRSGAVGGEHRRDQDAGTDGARRLSQILSEAESLPRGVVNLFTESGNTGAPYTSRRVSRGVQAGTVWTNAWAALNDGFAEGGYKQSGIGRLRGPLAISEFQEAKTVVHAVPPL